MNVIVYKRLFVYERRWLSFRLTRWRPTAGCPRVRREWHQPGASEDGLG